MFNGKPFNEKFLLTRKHYDFAHAINCAHKLTCVCAYACACNRTHLREQHDISLCHFFIFLLSYFGITYKYSLITFVTTDTFVMVINMFITF